MASLVGVLEHLSSLNMILQGKDLLVHELYTVIQASESKLIFLETS